MVPEAFAAYPLEVEDLTVSFGAGMNAVDGVSFTVEGGKIVGLVGESGCGKSLTLLSLAGLSPVDSVVTGSAKLGGDELIGLAPKAQQKVRRERVRVIFQDAATALDPLMSIGAQIMESLAVDDVVGKSQRRQKAIDLLDAVGIPDPEVRFKSKPHTLSGGMRQRVMIAIALAGSPDLILADEPTTALDVIVQAQILGLLREATAGATVVFVTHDMGVVGELTDNIVVMYAGTVVETGTTREVLKEPRHPYTAALLNSIPDPDGGNTAALPTIPGHVPPLGARGSGCPFADRCPRRGPACVDRPPLTATADGRQVACWYPIHASPV